MEKPNFFILGAPKCGTTSMDEWLRSHPSVYMAKKEPHYFNTDHQNRFITTLNDYQALFSLVTDQHIAVGETSVRYLYSREAVAGILNYNADAKFIVMLRDPIDMVYSWHNQVYFSDMEDVGDFESAWALQEQRLQGMCIPVRCSEVKMLFYGPVCRLGEQLERLYAQVPAAQIHYLFFDDLKANPGQIYRSVLEFLGVADDGKSDFSVLNPAKTYRIHTLKSVLPWLGKMKAGLGISRGFGILEWVRKKNRIVKKRAPMSMQMRRILIDYFVDDIELLSRLTGRSLDHWIK